MRCYMSIQNLLDFFCNTNKKFTSYISLNDRELYENVIKKNNGFILDEEELNKSTFGTFKNFFYNSKAHHKYKFGVLFSYDIKEDSYFIIALKR